MAISMPSEHAESATEHVSPLALSALGVTTFFLGASQANFLATTGLIGLLLFFGGLIQLLVGIRSSHTVHATAFTSYGGFWMAYGAMWALPGVAHTKDLGFFFLVWTILAGMVFLGTMRAHLAHVVIFLGFFLTFLALTIGAFTGASIFTTIGGWVGILTAIIASYTALASLGSPFKLPVG